MAVMTSSRSPARPTDEALAGALEFLRTMIVKTVDEVRPISEGLVVVTPSLPAVWTANQLRLTDAPDFQALLDLADEQLAEFGYRHIAIEDQAAGPELETAFRAAGWKVDRELVMVLGEAPDRAADMTAVTEASEDEVMELMARWFDEDPEPGGRGEHEQLVAYTRREAHVHGDRMLGVRSADGLLVAITRLRSDGSTAQVEDVYTVPEARRRGFARALVSRAVELAREAGAELTFITADDEDWPKLLYGRIGFRPAGHVWQFHRG
jgi:GNAT superfamily N-acetyltransferase